jgi:hypothetical protein
VALSFVIPSQKSERQSLCDGDAILAAPISPASERHYSVAEIASMWNLSKDTVRRLFAKEPGVLVLGQNGGRARKRRRYTTLRVPESVVERVHRRCSLVK